MIRVRTKDALRAYREGRRVSKRVRAMYPDGVPAEVLEATAGKLGGSLPQCRNLTDEGRGRLGSPARSPRRQAKRAEVGRGHRPPGNVVASSSRTCRYGRSPTGSTRSAARRRGASPLEPRPGQAACWIGIRTA